MVLALGYSLTGYILLLNLMTFTYPSPSLDVGRRFILLTGTDG